MNEETLLNELNDLCENVLCPMDLMDSITDYTNQKIIDELHKIVDNPFMKVPLRVAERLDELEELYR